MKTLKETKVLNVNFNKQTLEDIILNFADNGKTFTNEKQLQFEFANALKDKNFKIDLEVLSMSENELINSNIGKNKFDNLFTNIAVNLDNNQYIAIMLDYQLKNGLSVYDINNKITFTYSQNETPSYIEKIDRLQRLTKDKLNKISFNFDSKNIILKSYVLIFTNNQKVYEEYNPNDWKDYNLQHCETYGQGKSPLFKYLLLEINQ